MSASEMSTPSVSHRGMKEWPAPATRTRGAPVTMADSCASLVGRSMRCGAAETLPDQFLHSGIRRPFVLSGAD